MKRVWSWNLLVDEKSIFHRESGKACLKRWLLRWNLKAKKEPPTEQVKGSTCWAKGVVYPNVQDSCFAYERDKKEARVHINVHVYVCVYVCVCMCACMHFYTDVQVHTHTHAHTEWWQSSTSAKLVSRNQKGKIPLIYILRCPDSLLSAPPPAFSSSQTHTRMGKDLKCWLPEMCTVSLVQNVIANVSCLCLIAG